MKGITKIARRKASKLHGAQATFVSLVDAGANETPFTIIKSQDGAKAMPIKKRSNTKKSHKTVGTNKKAATPATRNETLIAKMVFSSEHFEDEAAVEEFLDGAEWDAETISIAKNDDGDWEARPNGLEDDDFTKVAKVELGDDGTEGVEAYVGNRTVEVKDADTSEDDDEDDDEAEDDTSEDDDDAEVEEVQAEVNEEEKAKKKPKYVKDQSTSQKSDGEEKPQVTLSKRAAFLKKRADERTKEVKFDAWDARFSKGNTLMKTLMDGMEYDKTPPGFHEVSMAFSAAVGNIVSDDGLGAAKQEALNKAAMDYAEIIGGLDTFFDAYVSSDEETLAKSFEEPELELLAKWAGDFADAMSGEAVTETKVVAKKAAPVQSIASDETNVVDLVTKALKPVMKRIEDVSETVTAMSTRAPTKKAADATDGEPAKPRAIEKKKSDDKETVQKTDEWMREKSLKGVFG